jgi:hypothetical protein
VVRSDAHISISQFNDGNVLGSSIDSISLLLDNNAIGDIEGTIGEATDEARNHVWEPVILDACFQYCRSGMA